VPSRPRDRLRRGGQKIPIRSKSLAARISVSQDAGIDLVMLPFEAETRR
jgi:hypothetical protein